MFVFQNGPRRWCRLVCPSLLGLPGARLWDLGRKHEAQVRLCSQNFVLKGLINDTIYVLWLQCLAMLGRDSLPRLRLHVLLGLLVTGLNLECVQIYIR